MKLRQKAGLVIATLATAAGSAVVTAPMAAADDGNVYAFDGSHFDGAYCSWDGPDADWTTCSGGGVSRNLRNQASSVWNNGFAGAEGVVNFYWDTGYQGAWACLDHGDSWENLPSGDRVFSWGSDRGGYWENINDNISSHKWVDFCGQP